MAEKVNSARLAPGDKIHLVLLPGMDGTGLLFEPLLTCLPENIRPQVIRYPKQADSYSVLVDYVHHQLPADKDFVLLAESFSGPVAYALANRAPSNLKLVIFVATFLSRPNPLLCFAGLLRGVFPLAPRLPRRIIRYWLLGEEADNALIDHFKQAVNQVPSAILFRRVQQIAKLHPPRQSIQLPCVYIQPDNDKLIDPQCICLFQSLCADFELVNVPGPHFLLQAKPEHVAAVLWRVIENKISHSSHG